MRGPAAVTSWSPSKLAGLDEDTLERITDRYSSDPLLAKRLADALNADAIADSPMMTDTELGDGEARLAALVTPKSSTQPPNSYAAKMVPK